MIKTYHFVMVIAFILQSCSPKTTISFNSEYSWAASESAPIHLSFANTKEAPFYFILRRDSNYKDIRLHVFWQASNNDILYNSYETSLKFLIDNEQILTFNPIKAPKIIAYNIDKKGHEEEGVFSLSIEQFLLIAYANKVMVQLEGKNKTVIGNFNRWKTFRAFKNFAENCQ